VNRHECTWERMLDFLEWEGKSSLTILRINAYIVRPCFLFQTIQLLLIICIDIVLTIGKNPHLPSLYLISLTRVMLKEIIFIYLHSRCWYLSHEYLFLFFFFFFFKRWESMHLRRHKNSYHFSLLNIFWRNKIENPAMITGAREVQEHDDFYLWKVDR